MPTLVINEYNTESLTGFTDLARVRASRVFLAQTKQELILK